MRRYVFRGHPVPKGSDGPTSFVPAAICPTPPALQQVQYCTILYYTILVPPSLQHYPNSPSLRPKAFEMIKDSIIDKKDEKKGREIFVNAQWAVGATGTGAPVRVLYTVYVLLCITCTYMTSIS